MKLLDTITIGVHTATFYFEVYEKSTISPDSLKYGDTMFVKESDGSYTPGIWYGLDDESAKDGWFISKTNGENQIGGLFNNLVLKQPKDEVVIRLLNSDPDFNEKEYLKSKGALPDEAANR